MKLKKMSISTFIDSIHLQNFSSYVEFFGHFWRRGETCISSSVKIPIRWNFDKESSLSRGNVWTISILGQNLSLFGFIFCCCPFWRKSTGYGPFFSCFGAVNPSLWYNIHIYIYIYIIIYTHIYVIERFLNLLHL